jgi:hypothetical protein
MPHVSGFTTTYVRHYDPEERAYVEQTRVLLVGRDAEALQIAKWLHLAGIRVVTTGTDVDVVVFVAGKWGSWPEFVDLANQRLPILVVLDAGLPATVERVLDVAPLVEIALRPVVQGDMVRGIDRLLRMAALNRVRAQRASRSPAK